VSRWYYALLAQRIGEDFYRVTTPERPAWRDELNWQGVCTLARKDRCGPVTVDNDWPGRGQGELLTVVYCPSDREPLARMPRPPTCRVPVVRKGFPAKDPQTRAAGRWRRR